MKHIIMNSTTCSGCSACAAVCSKGAIRFCTDHEGFMVPNVDENLCIDCGLCVKACPALTPKATDKMFTAKAFALQYTDEGIRSNSASGALFPAFAKFFIEELNGYVCGCILDENLAVKHIVSNKWEDVERMQDSKYVQSNMESCFLEIISLLKDGRHVLFSGTSCQVKGLLCATEKKHIETSKLLTIDFFCHGVPSPMVWKDYVNLYQKNTGIKAEGFKFRNKTYGWGKGTQSRGTGFLCTWRYKGTQYEDASLLARIWPRIFFSNLCLRTYCHTCPYTCVDKPADITMGDFWGIEDFHPEFNDGKGCSLAVIHSTKAEKMLLKLHNTNIIEVNIEEVINRQGNAFAPSKPHPLRDRFWIDYSNGSILEVLPKYFNYTFMGKIKAGIKYVLFKLHLRKYSY